MPLPLNQRMTFYITPEQHRWLRHLARERNVSVASLVRDAIDAYLPKERRSDKEPRRKAKQAP